MIVVADATPLISLMKTGRLELIGEMFGEIRIPGAVYDELISNPHFLKEAQQIQSNSYIRRIIVEDIRSVELLRKLTGLDLGESEAIILSDTCHADLLLMDEKKGRQVAGQMGLHLMGTIGMLRVAYEEGILSYEDIIGCIETLRTGNRHISEKLFMELLAAIRQ